MSASSQSACVSVDDVSVSVTASVNEEQRITITEFQVQ